mgnify:FL=1
MKFKNSTGRKISLSWHKLKLQTNRLNNLQIFQEARSRILLWYLVLMCLFTLIAIPMIRYRLISEVNNRVKEDLREALEEFEAELVESLLESKIKSNLEQTESEHAKQNIYSAFDKFIATNKAEDDNYFIAIVDGLFYKTNAVFLPSEIDKNSTLMQHWQEITVEEQAEIEVGNSKIGSVIYKAEPIKTTEKVIGVFIVAHISAGEREEVLNSVDIVIQVLVLMILLASLLAWLAAGKVLAPLRNLSETVKSISESDLSQRIDIQGKGEVAQLGRTFNAMMERLETAFDTQRNFINDAGHELKTPITIIRGHLELMDDDPQEQQKTINLVMDELDRMNRLVGDLVLLAKTERPDFLLLETIDLASFNPELFKKIQALGQRNWRLDNTSDGQIIGDRQRLTQAIINLANNAVQHTAVNDLIVFGSNLKSDKVEFWITDTGEGIPVGDQKHIFERFARVKNSRRRSPGSGLGLAIVKAIIEAHGGHIHLQSRLGVGSTFMLIFPVEFNEKH